MQYGKAIMFTRIPLRLLSVVGRIFSCWSLYATGPEEFRKKEINLQFSRKRWDGGFSVKLY
jgi:hypothetical protein